MPWTQDQMAARAARELDDGFYVNLGIGIPTLVANNVPDHIEVWLQSENGMLGVGPLPYEDEGVTTRSSCGLSICMVSVSIFWRLETESVIRSALLRPK